MVINGSSVLLSDSMFDNVSAKQQALLVAVNSTLVVHNTIFSGNSGTSSGAPCQQLRSSTQRCPAGLVE